MVLLDRLHAETERLHAAIDADAAALCAAPTAVAYRRYLTRTFGFVCPVERTLLDTPRVAAVLDPRRVRKHLLLQHDLQALGLRASEIAAIPQCLSIPWFEDVPQALGWAYALERTTLGHPRLYRHLAPALPGEIAFASSYLKCNLGAIGELWQRLSACVEGVVTTPADADRVVDAARAALQHWLRWRERVDGQDTVDDRAPRERAS